MTATTTTHWPRAIAHLDLDAFYAAVEVLDFPELKGKPLIVGGLPGSRGVVSTASYEARTFGVHSAMPSTRAARLCPHAVWRTPRMRRYVEKSREVRAVFARYTDLIEPLSLDEAFLDLTGSQRLFGPPEQIVRRIKVEIVKETGLVVSVGLAENKFLAKIASDLKKPDGFVVVPPGEENARAFLAPLPVSRLWGVGPKTAALLHELGFTTIGALAQADRRLLGRKLGEDAAAHLLNLSNGRDDREVEVGDRPKSIGRENTFATDLRDRAGMERELLAFADDVAAQLRRHALRAAGVTLKVRLGDFTTFTRAATLEAPTDLAEPLYAAARELLRTKADFLGQGVRLLGLTATRLVARGEHTEGLFRDEGHERRKRAAATVDRLRKRFGADAVTLGRLLEARPDNTGTPSDTPHDEE
jgi:DNA polymerase-4